MTMAPKRIQRQRTKGWRMPKGAIYVGRPSRWGNPWPVENVRAQLAMAYDWSGMAQNSPLWAVWAQFGLIGLPKIAHATSVALYRSAIEQARIRDPDGVSAWLAPLRGRDLVCWCPLDQPCHADVLLHFANREPNE